MFFSGLLHTVVQVLADQQELTYNSSVWMSSRRPARSDGWWGWIVRESQGNPCWQCDMMMMMMMMTCIHKFTMYFSVFVYTVNYHKCVYIHSFFHWACNRLIIEFVGLVGWGCRIHRLHPCRGVSLPRWVSWYITLNNLKVRLQECCVLLHCHHSLVHSGLEW